MGWEYFLIGIGILGCIFLAVCKFLFSKDNENLDVYYNKEVQETEEFLQAKQVFVRDPSEYHDKDKDGVDDILEN